MGAEVFATDVRPEAAEQVESMGARFVPLPISGEKSSDGYAKAMSEDQAQLAQRLYAEQSKLADIVITTANIPGRTSPILLDEEAVLAMKPGSVIVDMAAANGGNTTLTKRGERVVSANGVIINGPADLAGSLPTQASQLYGQNIVNLLRLMTPEKDGRLYLDLDDEIVRAITVCTDGEILWPPPPTKVSATSAPAEAAPPSEVASSPQNRRRAPAGLGLALAVVLGLALVLVTPTAAIGHYMVLALAVIVGFYVITNVTHSLHTPLMSVTNAISGIILVGAMLQIGSANLAVTLLSFVAIVVASINIFGGFTVTNRMLTMFQKG